MAGQTEQARDGARITQKMGARESTNGGTWTPGQERPVEARRWLTGPEADPLREPPWFVRGSGRRRARRKTRPLPRPQRFKRTTFWMRLRNSIVLVALASVVWLCGVGAMALAAQVRGFVPGVGSPTPVATHTASPAATRTAAPNH